MEQEAAAQRQMNRGLGQGQGQAKALRQGKAEAISAALDRLEGLPGRVREVANRITEAPSGASPKEDRSICLASVLDSTPERIDRVIDEIDETLSEICDLIF